MNPKRDSVVEAFSKDSDVLVVNEVPRRPKSGYKCLVEWSNEAEADWVTDGYNWKNYGKDNFSVAGFTYFKKYYKLRVAVKKYETAFRKIVVTCDKVPNRAFANHILRW
jgi:hypothetical protein